ncbi:MULTISPECIES: imidazolonepropionase [Rhizobium/Agrobacterium group]|uniref:Imidazolonepropionase n=2 Tax=Rhizobium/Agrobacterium group TaxID=227290 RepID=B9K289_ALLAM|nr:MULTISPECIES: imidazolonepropionase [Rhizobium/Agrobacterium group]ACM38987.1 imidazolonepropionase [Allorhizobium ampelinum S4]MCF1449679.1 imidazolonepropionase [Allorhizobium ampelinum]MCF1495186.1 imidazolonepropionase [Allorhizobium ampelinum]MUO31110.1 imidazolonepropionase [Agrobacterium vitis]MUO44540.1 imidazolonepropionase [Agrobacterium vitis]
MTHRDRIFTNARLATLNPQLSGLGIIEDAALMVRDGQLVYAGPMAELPISLLNAAEVTDCEGRWITPGLVDCHTHLVHAGNRAHEFEMRLAGASYEEIARAGGGIVSSVSKVRAASEADLLRETLPRLDALLAEGVTTIEVKSGYGLTVEDELKMLRAAKKLGDARPIAISTTYLGAHATPAEYKGRNGDFIREVVLPGLTAAHAEQLVDAVDGFCEGIAFSPDEMRVVFDAAQALGLPVKLHADQLSNLSGAALAAEYGALSADHLEYTDAAGADAMAKAGTVAVLLPGAFYFIRETKKPPVDLFRQHGTKMALATDNNPGTSPLTSLLLTMNMGATLFGMTVEECIAGVTREAARALGRLDEIGTLEAGKSADLAIWDISELSELVYRMGFNPLHQRVWRGNDA